MRNRIWQNLIRTKFQSIYLCHFNEFIRTCDKVVGFFMAFTSSAGVAGWLIWANYPNVWACIIGASQVVNMVKPYLPYVKHEDLLGDNYIFLEEIHLKIDKLWSNIERDKISEDEAHDLFYEILEEENAFLQKTKGLKVATLPWIEKKAREEWGDYLYINYHVLIESSDGKDSYRNTNSEAKSQEYSPA